MVGYVAGWLEEKLFVVDVVSFQPGLYAKFKEKLATHENSLNIPRKTMTYLRVVSVRHDFNHDVEKIIRTAIYVARKQTAVIQKGKLSERKIAT